ncbi:MAG TPA: response regulator [Gemmata sp.]|nr:response regulator [Gemmata sp.]
MINILVIDDDEQILHFLRTTLETEGYALRLASNGAEGILVYKRQPADLVLCDLYMDRKEGLETILELHRLFPQAKIIAMSGGSNSVPADFLDHARKFGAIACLWKPFNRNLLLQTIQNVLNDRGNA